MNMTKCPCLCDGQAQALNPSTFPPSQEEHLWVGKEEGLSRKHST